MSRYNDQLEDELEMALDRAKAAEAELAKLREGAEPVTDDEVRRKIELWFFRDMSDEQRIKLFIIFGMPVDEIGRTHGHQRKALRHILRTRHPTEQTDARSGVRVKALEWVPTQGGTWLRAEAAGFTYEVWAADPHADEMKAAAQDKFERRILSALSPAAPDPTPPDDDISRVYEEAVAPEGRWWHYKINYGPDGEENYANVYAPGDHFVGNLKIHHARAIVGGLNDAALSRPTERAVTEAWQPIETAPKDVLVLGYFGALPHAAPFAGPDMWAVWQDEFGNWYGDHHSSYTATEKPEPPTHWMPLPAAPALAQEGK